MISASKTDKIPDRPDESILEVSDSGGYLINPSPTFFISINSKGKTSFMSNEVLQILGFSLEEVIGKDFINTFIPERERKRLKEIFDNLKNNQKQIFIENHMIAKDNSELIVKCQWWQVLNQDNEIDFFYGVGSDITECIRAEEILKQNEIRYRVLEESVIDVIWILNMDLRLTFISSSIKRLIGYSANEVLGYPLEKIMTNESQQIFKKILMEGFSSGGQNEKEINRVLRVELELIHKDGYKVWTESKTKFIFDTSFHPVGILGVTRDITERKRAEEERQRLQAQLLHSQKMEAVGRLAGGIAHDFNNLLVVIMGYTDLLSMKLPKDNPYYDYISEIKSTATRAASLTKQLLSFSHKQILQPKLLDLNILISEIEKMLKRLISENIHLITIFDRNSAVIKADPTQISQIIMNLVLNARDSMPNGGELIIKTENISFKDIKNIESQKLKPSNLVCLTVQDTGIGIDQEMIKHIFEPFYTTKKHGEGTGLGLSVVYGIIKQHNGWIDVESEKGVGTTFKIYLPASDLSVDVPSNEGFTLDQGNGERILLVEDEFSVRKCIKKILQTNNYLVFDASSASKAITIFEKEGGNFDLLLIDIVLTDLNGFDLINKLKFLRSDIKVLLSSGYLTRKSYWSKIKEEQYPFLQKPYNIEDLLEAVKKSITTYEFAIYPK